GVWPIASLSSFSAPPFTFEGGTESFKGFGFAGFAAMHGAELARGLPAQPCAVRARSISSNSERTLPENDQPRRCEVAPGCTREHRKTHVTESRELLYPWHPWF